MIAGYILYQQTWRFLEESDYNTVRTIPRNTITSYNYNPIHQLADAESYYNRVLKIQITFGGLHIPESKLKYKFVIGVFKSGDGLDLFKPDELEQIVDEE
jgi:hypothetical protein